MSEWQALAELLVELDIQIEELDGWATRPEDVARLEDLEELRTDVLFALTFHYVPRGLRQRLSSDHHNRSLQLANEPRD